VSISPESGPKAGGTAITISGSGFVSGATVTVGETSCDNIVFLNVSTLTCVSPFRNGPGQVTLAVTNPT